MILLPNLQTTLFNPMPAKLPTPQFLTYEYKTVNNLQTKGDRNRQ